jgi:hypothetical protein
MEPQGDLQNAPPCKPPETDQATDHGRADRSSLENAPHGRLENNPHGRISKRPHACLEKPTSWMAVGEDHVNVHTTKKRDRAKWDLPVLPIHKKGEGLGPRG